MQVYNISRYNSLKHYLQKNNIDYDSFYKQPELNILDYNKKNNNGKIIIDNVEKDFFVKYSPLVDPIKYITNTYIEQKVENNENINIEKYLNNTDYILDLHNDDSYEENMKKLKNKINYPMNCALIDSFFTHLSTLLKNEANFYHGLDIYTSFTCIKEDYKIDIGDSIECIDDNKEMFKNVKQNFVSFINKELEELYLSNSLSFDSDNEDDFINSSKHNRPLININKEEINMNNLIDVIDDMNDSNNINLNNDKYDELNDFSEEIVLNLDNSLDLKLKNKGSLSEDDNNSEESFTDSELDNEELDSSSLTNSDCEGNDEDSDDEYSDEESDEESEDDPEIFVSIKKIPVETIIMEKCENTLDYLLEEELINMEELESALFQVIMNLLCYQKAFKMTHNDLHTNNIMFINTDKQFLYYNYNNLLYKVPTFGKIYKIIDFGRSIFTFKGKVFASDSFNKNEDADTQYNCEPFFDDKLKRIDNNYSFDLCRLGTSLIDFFIDDISDIKEMKKVPIVNLIIEWLHDDNNKNILYKSDGSTRYPGFKIYKMIARNVHNHTPELQLNKQIFDKYIIKSSTKAKQILKKYSKKIIKLKDYDDFFNNWN